MGSLTVFTLAACICATAAGASLPQSLPAPSAILASMQRVTAAFRAAHPENGDCHWERATYYFGLTEAMADTGAADQEYARAWARSNKYACGGSLAPNDIGAGWGYSALDTLTPGVPGALALGATMEAALKGNALPAYSWWWVDTLSMNVPQWVYYARALNRSDYIDFAHAQYNATKFGTGAAAQPGLWSPAHGLWYRDHTFVASSPPVFWARGQAWAAATVIKTLSLDVLPASHALARDLEATLQAMAVAVVPLQGADGLWRANMLDAAAFPEPETSGSAGLVALLAFGVHTGRLPAATYAPVVAAGWAGLVAALRNGSTAVGGCQPEGAQPGPSSPSSTSDFCSGLWLLAATHVLALARAPPPADLRDFEARLLPQWVSQFALSSPAGGYAFSDGDTHAHAYGSAGVVHALSVVGALDANASNRAAVAAVANSFSNPAGFYNLSGPEIGFGYQPWHSGGWVGAALRILGARPAAPPATAIAIAEAGPAVWEATFMSLINGSAGVNVWDGSHKVAAIPVQLMQWDAQWAVTYGPFFNWFWGFLNNTSSPLYGYWCLGNPPPPLFVCLGGAFHIAFTLTCGAQPLPNAAAMLDATLALQNTSTGLWRPGTVIPGYIDQDGVYVSVRASLQLGQARWGAVRTMCASYVRAAAAQLMSEAAILGAASPYGSNAHMLAGLVTPVAECAKHFPDLVITRTPWVNTVDLGCFG